MWLRGEQTSGLIHCVESATFFPDTAGRGHLSRDSTVVGVVATESRFQPIVP